MAMAESASDRPRPQRPAAVERLAGRDRGGHQPRPGDHPSLLSVAAAPAIGAMVGIGGSALWDRRSHVGARVALAVALAATAVWSFALLDRAPQWMPWLAPAGWPWGSAVPSCACRAPRLRGRAALAFGVVGICSALAGPAAYALDTALTPHSGAIPSAGPSSASGPGGGPGLPGGTFGGAPGANVGALPGAAGAGHGSGATASGLGAFGARSRSGCAPRAPRRRCAGGFPGGSPPSSGSAAARGAPGASGADARRLGGGMGAGGTGGGSCRSARRVASS